MAVRVIKELVCDLCGSDESVRRWRITRTSDGKTVSPDLCSEDSKFLESIFKKLPAGKRGQTRARQVVSESDVKKMRRTRPK